MHITISSFLYIFIYTSRAKLLFHAETYLLLLAGVRGESQVRLSRQYFPTFQITESRSVTHVDSLDIITEKLLDLLALDRGVDDNVVSGYQLFGPGVKERMKLTQAASWRVW
jgi:hypothetical protein